MVRICQFTRCTGTARGHRPTYRSPDYNPIEHLWRNVKRDKTHNRYFPTFEALSQAVDAGLTKFQNDPAAVKQLMGAYLDQLLELELAT